MRRVDWLTPQEAAHRLGVSVTTVRRLAAADVLDPEPRSGRLRVSTTSVTRHVAEEARWITRSEAARMLGCSTHRIAALLAGGVLIARRAARGRPVVRRDDVEALAGDLADGPADNLTGGVVDNDGMESHA